MKLSFKFNQDDAYVFVDMHNDNLKISDFYIFDAIQFNKRYLMDDNKLNMNALKDDLVDTYLDTVASVPYSKDNILKNLYVGIHSNIFKNILLTD